MISHLLLHEIQDNEAMFLPRGRIGESSALTCKATLLLWRWPGKKAGPWSIYKPWTYMTKPTKPMGNNIPTKEKTNHATIRTEKRSVSQSTTWWKGVVEEEEFKKRPRWTAGECCKRAISYNLRKTSCGARERIRMVAVAVALEHDIFF